MLADSRPPPPPKISLGVQTDPELMEEGAGDNIPAYDCTEDVESIPPTREILELRHAEWMRRERRQNPEASQDVPFLEPAGSSQDVTVPEPSGTPGTSNEEDAELGIPPHEMRELRRLNGQPGFEAYLTVICSKYIRRDCANLCRRKKKFKELIRKKL